MTEQKRGKLNKLLQELPEGLLASAAWLESKGYSSALRNQYVKAGWLDQPVRGVFRRPGGLIKWQHVVISMQTLLDIHPLVGGRTALELCQRRSKNGERPAEPICRCPTIAGTLNPVERRPRAGARRAG